MFLFWRHPEKALDISVPGIGHSDIRGFGSLLTDRSMVRREPCCLLAWIIVLYADIVQSQIARTLKYAKALPGCLQSFGFPAVSSTILLTALVYPP